MFTQSKGKLCGYLDKLINSCGNITLYIDKSINKSFKNKTAVSIITNEAYKTNFDSTIIQFNDNSIRRQKDESSMVQMGFTNINKETIISSNVLSYDGCMALIYKMSLDGFLVSDIANVKSNDELDFISVEEIDHSTDMVKVSYSDGLKVSNDKILKIVDNSIKNNTTKRSESTIIKVEIQKNKKHNLEEIIDVAFNKTYYMKYKNVLYSDKHDKMSILGGDKVACVVNGGEITITNFGRIETANNFKEVIGRILDRYMYDYSIKSTGNIVMLP